MTHMPSEIFIGKLRAIGELMKKGSTVGVLTCNIYDEKDELVAYSKSTCMVLQGNENQKHVQIK